MWAPAGFFRWHSFRSMVLHKVPQVSKNFSHLANRYKMSARFVQEQRRPKLSDHHGSAKNSIRRSRISSCPEQGCVKVYKEFKGLEKHRDVGRHLIKLERESDYDSIIAKWAETCKTVTGDYVQGEVGGAPSVTESPSVSADNPSLEEGWVRKKSKKSIRVSERVRSYLPFTFKTCILCIIAE